MKFGVCINMFGSENDPIGRALLPKLSGLGCDYIEVPLAQVMDLDDAGFEALCGEIKAAGLHCETCNNAFPASVRLTGVGVDREKIAAYLDAAFARAAKLGAKVIVFGSSGAKNVPAGFSHKEAFGQIVEAGHLIAAAAEKYDLMIAIEPICRREANIIKTLEEGAQLMEAIGSERVKLLVDYYHFVVEKEKLSALERYGAHIIHSHVAAPAGRTVPTRLPEQMQNFLHAVSAMPHEPRMSIEATSTDPLAHLPQAFAVLRAEIAK